MVLSGGGAGQEETVAAQWVQSSGWEGGGAQGCSRGHHEWGSRDYTVQKGEVVDVTALCCSSP